MRAAVWHGAGDLRVEQVEEPGLPPEGQAVVEVFVACICASDVAEYRDGPHVIPTTKPHPLTGRCAPITLGHEYAGRVVAVGPGVDQVSVGDRVCGDACIRCGRCFWCLRGEYNICAEGGAVGLHADGAFARYLKVPAYTLFSVPEAVSDRDAAVVEPLAVGLHALKRGRCEIGEKVVVFGFGMIGAAAALFARLAGAAIVMVVDQSPTRRRLAQSLGITQVLNPDTDTVTNEIRTRTGGLGADLVLDCTGIAHVLPQALSATRRGGRTVVTGIAHEPATIAMDRLVYFEREIIGALGYTFDHPSVLAFLADGRLELPQIFGETIDLIEIRTKGFDRLLIDKEAPLRIPVAPA